MKYCIIERNDLFHIKLSGETKRNESILAMSALLPYLKGKDIRVIIDMKELEKYEIITLTLVVSGIRKKIRLLGGELRLCSLKSEMQKYFKENHLDQIFEIYESVETAQKSEWRNES